MIGLKKPWPRSSKTRRHLTPTRRHLSLAWRKPTAFKRSTNARRTNASPVSKRRWRRSFGFSTSILAFWSACPTSFGRKSVSKSHRYGYGFSFQQHLNDHNQKQSDAYHAVDVKKRSIDPRQIVRSNQPVLVCHERRDGR